MVAPDVVAALPVDLGGYLVAETELSVAHRGQVHSGPDPLQAHHIFHGGAEILRDQAARVRDLAPRLQIEGGPIEYDVSFLPGSEHLDTGETRAVAVATEPDG